MGIERGEGFVLRTRPFGEADLIVTLFFRHYGKRVGIAKGARRLDSRLGGVFDLLNKVEVVFYSHDRLDLVSQGTLLDSYESVKHDLAIVNSALAVARLLDRLLPMHQPESAVYQLFTQFLARCDQEDVEQLQITAELRILSLLGHRPHLRACLHCGDTHGPFRFVPTRGGVLCQRCAPNTGIPVDAGLARALDWLGSHSIDRAGVVHLSPQEMAQARAILSAYIETIIRGG